MIFSHSRNVLGEGIHVTPEGSGIWVDIRTRKLFVQTAEEIIEINLPMVASKVLSAQSNSVLLITEFGVAWFDMETERVELVDAAPPYYQKVPYRPNDGVILDSGAVVYGRMQYDPVVGSGDIVASYGGKSKVVGKGIAIPNTFVPLPGEAKILISDSLVKKTYAVEFDWPAGEIIDQSLWHDFSGHAGTPDGGLLTSDGYVYIAMWGAGCVAKLDCAGHLIDEIQVAAIQPTSAAFVDGNEALLVTSATDGLDASDLRANPGSGFLQRVDL